MKAIMNMSFQCECGWYMLRQMNSPGGALTATDTIKCDNPDCLHHGKKFKTPTIELEEIKS